MPAATAVPEPGAPVPTSVAEASPGPTSALTASATLNASGPWLLGLGGDDQLVALNPDGTGLSALEHRPLWDPYP